MLELTTTRNFEEVECGGCGISFAMTEKFYSLKLKDQTFFYCPNGCRRHFIGKTKEQKLEDKVKLLRMRNTSMSDQLSASERSNSALKGVVTRKKNQLTKVKNGVCPCCDRFFENLHRHIKNQHPKFDPQKPM